MKLRLLVELDPETNRWSAVFPELPGCASAGDTEEEAVANAKEALQLWFEPSPVKLHKLSASAALAASGALPENVNYAVKSSLLLSFLESVPAVSAKLKVPNTVDRKFEDVVKSAQDAAVRVLVY
jgi:predicted RNase H-like HicB family nuclease